MLQPYSDDRAAGDVELHHAVRGGDGEWRSRCLVGFLFGHRDRLVHGQGVHWWYLRGGQSVDQAEAPGTKGFHHPPGSPGRVRRPRGYGVGLVPGTGVDRKPGFRPFTGPNKRNL